MPRKKPRGVDELTPAEMQAEARRIDLGVVSLDDVARVPKLATALLEMAERSPESLKAVGLTMEDPEISRLRDAARFRMPTARAMVASAIGQGLVREEILALYYRGMQALHALAPLIVYGLAAKVDDANAPGDRKVMLEIAKGIGLFKPAEAVSSKQRFDELGIDKLRERARTDPASLKREILSFT